MLFRLKLTSSSPRAEADEFTTEQGVLRNIDMPCGMGQPRDLLSDYQVRNHADTSAYINADLRRPSRFPLFASVSAPLDRRFPFTSFIDFEKCFEAPDPVEWCPRGYALVHVDARGSGFSEGNLDWWGKQITEDVYDACEWISKQSWSNGAVGMTGSSWLGINQWWAAATDDPHPALKAVQPWEGLTDGYRQSDVRGGINNSFFPSLIAKGFAGLGKLEGYPKAIDSRPLYDDYWKSKSVPMDKLSKVPFYVIASYSSMLHTEGSVAAFRQAPIQDKW